MRIHGLMAVSHHLSVISQNLNALIFLQKNVLCFSLYLYNKTCFYYSLMYLWCIYQDIMCEFRAGKMSLEGTRVIPDTRKGLVRIGRVCMLSFICVSSTIIYCQHSSKAYTYSYIYWLFKCNYISTSFVGWRRLDSFSVAWPWTKHSWRCILFRHLLLILIQY